MAEELGFPPTKKAAVVAGGHHTDIVVSEYADKFLVIVTQFLKIGTVVQASADAAHEKRKTYTGACVCAGVTCVCRAVAISRKFSEQPPSIALSGAHCAAAG